MKEPTRKCFFCGNADQIVLEEHHVYPRWVEKVREDIGLNNLTIVLCSNCHKKVHYLLSYYKEIIQEKTQESVTPESELKASQEDEERLYLTTIWVTVKSIFAEQKDQILTIESVIQQIQERLADCADLTREKIEIALSFLVKQGVIYHPTPETMKVVQLT